MSAAEFASAIVPPGPVEFSKANYQSLRSKLRFDRPFLPTLAILLLDGALLGCAVALLRAGGLPSYLLSQLLLAVTFFNAFAVLHECGHGTASRHAWLNALVGHLTSSFCLIPYYPWKYIHQKHHTWTGNLDHDPVLKSVRTWRDARVPWLVRAAWRTWIPLGAFLQHGVYIFYPLVMWRRGELTRAKLIRTLISVAWLPASWFVFWLLAPDVVHPSNVALAVLLFLIAEELVNIPHHVDMSTYDGKLPLWEQYRATRSCYYPPGISELLVLNFNFHTEHHLFPDLPWYRLRAARASLRAMLGKDYQEAIGIAWNLEHRRRDLDSIVEGYRRSS